MKYKNILLTGATGQLGRAILGSGCFPDVLLPGRQDLDIVKPASVQNFFKLNDIDAVVHCAALARIAECEADPIKAIETNIAGTASIIKEVVKQENKNQKQIRFVHISTDGVYACTRGNYKEKDETIPYSKYGWTKLGAECAVRALSNYCIIRTSFFDPDNIKYEDAADDMYSSKVEIGYLAKAIAFLLDHDFVGIINVGSPRESDYERYRRHKPGIKKCAREDIIKNLPFGIYEDASLNTDLWNSIKPNIWT